MRGIIVVIHQSILILGVIASAPTTVRMVNTLILTLTHAHADAMMADLFVMGDVALRAFFVVAANVKTSRATRRTADAIVKFALRALIVVKALAQTPRSMKTTAEAAITLAPLNVVVVALAETSRRIKTTAEGAIILAPLVVVVTAFTKTS